MVYESGLEGVSKVKLMESDEPEEGLGCTG
jgi:nitrogenase subunit NifH